MTLVKICGITNLEDALCSVEAGAGALGFNFYRPSPRYIDPATAREIIDQLPSNVMSVGVFVNEDLETLRTVASNAGVTALQLHGDESPQYCASVSDWEVIKAFAVGEDFDLGELAGYDVHAVMVDARHTTLRGGTGLTTNWSIATRLTKSAVRLFLAGGLSPENVVEAINLVNPFAVDACSSLEDRPGKKDSKRVQAFLKAVQRA